MNEVARMIDEGCPNIQDDAVGFAIMDDDGEVEPWIGTAIMGEAWKGDSMSLKFKEVAKEIAERETGKVQISIAQASEVLRIVCQILCDAKASDAMAFIEKYGAIK